MTTENLRIRALKCRGVSIPINRPLYTSGGAVTTAPYVLIDLETEEGVTGCAYVFCYATRFLAPMMALFAAMEEVIAGEPVAPGKLEEKLQATFRLAGPQGFAGWAISGIDMAAWDTLAKARGTSLITLLGGAPTPTPAYNSCGLGIIGAEKAGPEARELYEAGFDAIKVRLGYPTRKTDLEVVREVRKSISDGVLLMSDYNQSLSVAEARVRANLLGDEGVYWIEEPTRFDDYVGHGEIRERSPVPIQMGENCWGPQDMAKALQAKAADFFMPDLGKIGGVTGWLRAIGMAEPLGLPLSSHLYPELSAQMLAVTPTRHWLEYVDWANPILQAPLKIVEGKAQPFTGIGSGIAWDEGAVKHHLFDR